MNDCVLLRALFLSCNWDAVWVSMSLAMGVWKSNQIKPFYWINEILCLLKPHSVQYYTVIKGHFRQKQTLCWSECSTPLYTSMRIIKNIGKKCFTVFAWVYTVLKRHQRMWLSISAFSIRSLWTACYCVH